MTAHATSGETQNVPEPTFAERVRTLLETESVGTLATLSKHHPGWPFASVMPYAITTGGSPLFLISSMAVHTQNLVADPHASFLVMQSGAGSDPLGSPRATLMGNAHRLDDATDELRDAYLRRHHSAKHWIGYSDFSFYRLDVTNIYYVGGFGVMGWVPPDDYATAQCDPLADASAGIIEHMNRDHDAALRDILRHFAKLEATEAQMMSCDRLGFVIRAKTAEGMKGRRIAFPEEVRSAADARRVLVAMTKQSR
jgi:heme iron utilization protein